MSKQDFLIDLPLVFEIEVFRLTDGLEIEEAGVVIDGLLGGYYWVADIVEPINAEDLFPEQLDDDAFYTTEAEAFSVAKKAIWEHVNDL